MADNSDPGNCGIPVPMTLTVAPNFEQYYYAPSGEEFTMSVSCSFDGTTSGLCTGSDGGANANFPGLSTYTLGSTDLVPLPITLTSNLDAYFSSEFGLAVSATATAGASMTEPTQTSTQSVAENGSASIEASSMPFPSMAQSTPGSVSASMNSVVTQSSSMKSQPVTGSSGGATGNSTTASTAKTTGGAAEIGINGSLFLGSLFALVASLL